MRGRFFICLLPLLLLAGCSGYKLGPSNGMVAGEKSVQINPFKNETLEPRLSEPITREIRKRVQQDGTYKLATHNEGDLIVTGTILGYSRSPISYEPSDVITARDYHVTISARIVAVDRVTGKTNANQVVRGRTSIRVGSDLTSAERQAIPLVAADLAGRAVSVIADGTW